MQLVATSRLLAVTLILTPLACDDPTEPLVLEDLPPGVHVEINGETPEEFATPKDNDEDEPAEPDDRAAEPEESAAYCIPQTWSGGCNYMMNYECCPPEASQGASCAIFKCTQNILDSNCVLKVNEYLRYSGCTIG